MVILFKVKVTMHQRAFFFLVLAMAIKLLLSRVWDTIGLLLYILFLIMRIILVLIRVITICVVITIVTMGGLFVQYKRCLMQL